MRRSSQVLGTIALCASFMASTAAWARTEVLRWQHSDPSSVQRFTIHVGDTNGQDLNQVNVGKPTAVNGVYTYSLTVADNLDVRVAVSALGTNGLESNRSNVQTRTAPSSPPPTPPPNNGQLGTPGRPRVIGQ